MKTKKKKAKLPPEVREFFVKQGKAGYKKRMSGKTKSDIRKAQSEAGKRSAEKRKISKLKK